jgi:hypothetical protein
VLPSGLLDGLAALPDISGIAGVPEKAEGTVRLYPFPAFTALGLTDYIGRTVQESLAAVELLTGLRFEMSRERAALGRGFWMALIRGGYQGAVYYLDMLR